MTAIAVSSGGGLVATGTADWVMRVSDAVTQHILWERTGHLWEVTSVAFSPNGDRLVSGGGDGAVKVWMAQTGALVTELTGHSESVSSLRFDPSGAWIVSGTSEGTLGVWDAETGRLRWRRRCSRGGVSCVAFSRLGEWIVSGSSRGGLSVWSALDGSRIARASISSDVLGVEFRPTDDEVVVVAIGEGARVLRVARPKLVAMTSVTAHTARGCTALSPNAQDLAIGDADGLLQIVSTETGERQRTIAQLDGSVERMSYAGDARFVAVQCAGRGPTVIDAERSRVVTEPSVEEVLADLRATLDRLPEIGATAGDPAESTGRFVAVAVSVDVATPSTSSLAVTLTPRGIPESFVSWVELQLVQAEGPVRMLPRRARTDTHGRATFAAIPSGRYAVRLGPASAPRGLSPGWGPFVPVEAPYWEQAIAASDETSGADAGIGTAVELASGIDPGTDARWRLTASRGALRVVVESPDTTLDGTTVLYEVRCTPEGQADALVKRGEFTLEAVSDGVQGWDLVWSPEEVDRMPDLKLKEMRCQLVRR